MDHARECVFRPLASMLLEEGEGLILAAILEGFADTKTPLQRMQWVYQYLDPQHSLLYVGMTGAFLTRAAQHSARSEWIDEASSVRYELWCCRAKALEMEAEYIHRLAPKHNILHNLARQKGKRVASCDLCVNQHQARRFALPGDDRLATACPSCGSTEHQLGALTYECSKCARPWLLAR